MRFRQHVGIPKTLWNYSKISREFSQNFCNFSGNIFKNCWKIANYFFVVPKCFRISLKFIISNFRQFFQIFSIISIPVIFSTITPKVRLNFFLISLKLCHIFVTISLEFLSIFLKIIRNFYQNISKMSSHFSHISSKFYSLIPIFPQFFEILPKFLQVNIILKVFQSFGVCDKLADESDVCHSERKIKRATCLK